MGGAIQQAYGINKGVLFVLEALFVCGVNCFVLCTGYYMCMSVKRNVTKPVKLIIQTSIYNCALYCISCMFTGNFFSIKSFVGSIIPASYFCILYIALYLISPLINLAFQKITDKKLIQVLIVLSCILSIEPYLVDLLQYYVGRPFSGLSFIGVYGDGDGYTLVNFVLMYIIGLVIRRKIKDIRQIKVCLLVIALVLNNIAICGCSLLFYDMALSYCNPLVILEAVLLFLVFERIKLKESVIIGKLSTATFSVYLLNITFVGDLPVEKLVDLPPVLMITAIMVVVSIIYLLCFVIDLVYSKIMDSLVYRLIPVHRLQISYVDESFECK